VSFTAMRATPRGSGRPAIPSRRQMDLGGLFLHRSAIGLVRPPARVADRALEKRRQLYSHAKAFDMTARTCFRQEG
jgi:hypothetical protein